LSPPATKTKRDYYEVLGIDRSATREQIRRAYRRLALKHHPDRNKEPGAAERFKEIAEAYAVLSDDAKRREYDATGHAGVSERWTTEDLFRDFTFGDFFGGRLDDLSSLFGDLFGRRARPRRGAARGTDLHYDLELTLEEAAKGGDRTIQVTRSGRCPVCGGSGAKPGTKSVTCVDCRGTGHKEQVRAGKGVRIATTTACARCAGRGLLIESPCETCRASGVQFASHALKVQIPPGVEEGMVIHVEGQGELNGDGGSPGDLLIRMHVRPHPSFQRHGDDLYTSVAISFAEAALGLKREIPCLRAGSVLVTIPAGTQSGTYLRLTGKGMPRVGGKGKGDLFVAVEVRTPTNLTARQRELLEEFGRLEAKRPAGGST
jgi:molecular chaperone DnaJ